MDQVKEGKDIIRQSKTYKIYIAVLENNVWESLLKSLEVGFPLYSSAAAKFKSVTMERGLGWTGVDIPVF